jgi:hypothetical protein
VPDLQFAVEGAEATPSAATPQVELALRVSNATEDERIHSALLRCQVKIDAARRRYSAREEALLRDVLGPRSQWNDTLRALAWTQTSVVVPSFSGSIVVCVPLTCTVDVTQGPAKLLFALDDGVVPLTLLFSGTVFYAAPDGALQVGNVSWDREARFGLPVELVKRVAELHHSGAAFLSLRRDVFDRLHGYRVAQGHASWDHAIESLLGRDPRRSEDEPRPH